MHRYPYNFSMKYLLCMLLFFPHISLAQSLGFNFAASIHPNTRIIRKSAETDSTRIAADLYLGYLFANSGYGGIIYSGNSEEIKQSGFATPSDNKTVNRERTSIGVTAGYLWENFYLLFSYYFQSEWRDNFGSSLVVYQKGSGFQLDLGVRIKLTEWLYFAPQLSFQSFVYTESVTDGVSAPLSPEMTDTSISPFLVLGLKL